MALKEKSITLGTVAVRAAAFGLRLSGQSKASDALYALADAVDAGVRVDEHMEAVGELLKARALTDADWDDVMARIARDSAALQAVQRD